MIPFAMAFFTLTGLGGTKALRILDLSALGFRFRVPDTCPPAETAELFLFDIKLETYIRVPLNGFTLEKEESFPFFTEYFLHIPFPLPELKSWMSDYSLFTRLKQEGNDEVLARRFTLSTVSPLSIAEPIPAALPLGLSLETPELCELFLRSSFQETIRTFLHRFPCPELLPTEPDESRITYLYFGNEFCIHLFPPEEQLFSLLKKSIALSRVPVIVLPPLDACSQESICHRVSRLCLALSPAQVFITVNDWGTLLMLSGLLPACASLILGTLFNKRKKDPRISRLNAIPQAESTVNVPEVGELLLAHRVTCIAFESLPESQMPVPRFESEVHLPYYQMCTAGFCLTRAEQEKHIPRQDPVPCPGYCLKNRETEPVPFPMIPRFNSLFSLCPKAGLSFASRAVIHL